MIDKRLIGIVPGSMRYVGASVAGEKNASS